MNQLVEYVKEEMCERYGHRLLYLCKFGSHLYGTATEESDLDLKGIFLPNKEHLLLGNKIKSLRYNSGSNNDRNSKNDVDIELWSLQYFFELLGKGETNAIDLAYSPTNKSCVEYIEDSVDKMIFENPREFFNSKDINAFIGYAIGQAKKYGVKGSRLGVLKRVYEYLKDVIYPHIEPDQLHYYRLSDIIEDILNNFYDDSFCFMKFINDEEALVLCGKVHLFSIKLEEFYYRIKREYEKYGERAKKAEKNEGIDWKAISHAMRCIYQMEELLEKGKIEYPLSRAKELLEIKNGQYDWTEVEKWIYEGLERIEGLQEMSKVTGRKNEELKKYIILTLYKEAYFN